MESFDPASSDSDLSKATDLRNPLSLGACAHKNCDGCQRFKSSPDNVEICGPCKHYDSFHKSPEIFPTAPPQRSSTWASIASSQSCREQLQQTFRTQALNLGCTKRKLSVLPGNQIPNPAAKRPATIATAPAAPKLKPAQGPGRPAKSTSIVQFVVVPEVKRPKLVVDTSKGSSSRFECLENAGLIKTFQIGGTPDQCTAEAMRALLSQKFGGVGLHEWVAYSVNGKLLSAVDQPADGWTYSNLKEIATRTNRRIYIGPKSIPLRVAGLDDSDSEEDEGNFVDIECSPTRDTGGLMPGLQSLGYMPDLPRDPILSPLVSPVRAFNIRQSSRLIDAPSTSRGCSSPPFRVVRSFVPMDLTEDDDDDESGLSGYQLFMKEFRHALTRGSTGESCVWYIRKATLVDDFFEFADKTPDLRKQPIIRFEEGTDYGGVFRCLFGQFWSAVVELHETASVGAVFVGDLTMTVTHVSQEMGSPKPGLFRCIGKLLFVCLAHRGPFPTQLDDSVFRYMLGLDPKPENVRYVDRLAGDFINQVRDSDEESDFLPAIDGLIEWLSAFEQVRYVASKWNQLNKEETIAKIARTYLYDARSGNLNLIKEGFDQYGDHKTSGAALLKITDASAWSFLWDYIYRVVITGPEFLKEVTTPTLGGVRQRIAFGHFRQFIESADPELLQRTLRFIVGFANIPLQKKVQVTFETSGIHRLPAAKSCTPSITLGTSYEDGGPGFEEFSRDMVRALDEGSNNFTMA
ncbi:hypothetical protein BV898_03862 [Hypsibius exemplaris]|uniref:HECT domain-containing protein n=1 Tax=Hypsibius exemplaris TaxID=2072580 RepID=A0A1W0X4E7_HYPEX|nr:hypothetical protein BV898_03862 [Hypsibius exemplaris]